MPHRYPPNKLIFVGGAPRSGTTLVQRVLISHPDITGGPELDVVPSVANVATTAVKGATSRLKYFFDEDRARMLFRHLICDLFETIPPTPASFVSEKTPSNALVFRELRELMPEAMLVFAYRDPRAVIASMLQVGLKGAKAIECRCIDSAIDHVNSYYSTFLNLDSNDCFPLKYETLVSDPAAATAGVFRRVGLDPLPADFEIATFPARAADIQAEAFYSDDQLQSPVVSSRSTAWKDQLTTAEVRHIERRILDCWISRQYFDPRRATIVSRAVANCRWIARRSRATLSRLAR